MPRGWSPDVETWGIAAGKILRIAAAANNCRLLRSVHLALVFFGNAMVFFWNAVGEICPREGMPRAFWAFRSFSWGLSMKWHDGSIPFLTSRMNVL